MSNKPSFNRDGYYTMTWCPAHGSFAVRASQVRQSCPRCQAAEYARETRSDRLASGDVYVCIGWSVAKLHFAPFGVGGLRVDRPDP